MSHACLSGVVDDTPADEVRNLISISVAAIQVSAYNRIHFKDAFLEMSSEFGVFLNDV